MWHKLGMVSRSCEKCNESQVAWKTGYQRLLPNEHKIFSTKLFKYRKEINIDVLKRQIDWHYRKHRCSFLKIYSCFWDSNCNITVGPWLPGSMSVAFWIVTYSTSSTIQTSIIFLDCSCHCLSCRWSLRSPTKCVSSHDVSTQQHCCQASQNEGSLFSHTSGCWYWIMYAMCALCLASGAI